MTYSAPSSQVQALAEAQCEGHHRIKISHKPEQWCSVRTATGDMLLQPMPIQMQAHQQPHAQIQLSQWSYLDDAGVQYGPFAVAQLQEWFHTGQLTMDRKLRRAGDDAGEFVPLSSIAELVSQLQPSS
jgi:hypothetical protein